MEQSPHQQNSRPVFISGHRNPDLDSIMSACALGALKRALGYGNVTPICPGILPERAAWVFRHFGLTPPKTKNDVYLRMTHIMNPDFPTVSSALSAQASSLTSSALASLVPKSALNVSSGLLLRLFMLTCLGENASPALLPN